MSSIGKSRFRILNPDFGFSLEREILFQGGFQLQNPNPDFMDFLLLPFDREIRKIKGICKLINCQL